MRMVGRQWRHVDRDATRNGIPANADCRVRGLRNAKIPPPVVTMQRNGFCGDVACRVAVI